MRGVRLALWLSLLGSVCPELMAGDNILDVPVPELAQMGPPDGLKVGLRLIFQLGTIHAGTPVPRPKDDPDKLEDSTSSGPESIDVLAIDGNRCILRTTILSTGAASLMPMHTATAWSDVRFHPTAWAHPKGLELALGRATAQVGVAATTMPIGDQERPVIGFTPRLSGGDTVGWVFDRETGLLLSYRYKTIKPNRSWTSITRDFVSARQRSIPWADAAPPDWLPTVTGLDTVSSEVSRIAGVEYPRPQQQASYTVVERGRDWLALRAQTGGQPEAGGGATILAANSELMGYWIPPSALGALTAGQVLDEDPTLGFRVEVEAVTPEMVVVRQSAAAFVMQLAYDPASGRVIASQTVKTLIADTPTVTTARFTWH